MVSAAGLFDVAALRELFAISRRELLLSLITTLGVLFLGALEGVFVAVALTFLWLLQVGSWPHDAILGRTRNTGVRGFHSLQDHPEAITYPGLLLYRFDSDLLFYNVDYFRQRVREAMAAAETPVEWIVIDASPINVLDLTAAQKLAELREELAAQGVVLAYARAKQSLARFFGSGWAQARRETLRAHDFPTVGAAVKAFRNRHKTAATSTSGEQK